MREPIHETMEIKDFKDLLQKTEKKFSNRPAFVYKTDKPDEYKTITHKEFRDDINSLGTELISIINKTTDINNNHNIPKDENNYYLDNGENSIKIYINFIYKDKTKTLQMEDINKGRYRRIYKKI